MKKYIKVLIIILILAGTISGYCIWCSYNPIIYIQINVAGRGEELKVEMPNIAYAERHKIEIAKSVKNNLDYFNVKSENILQDVLNNYLTSDIKLDIKVKNNQTILNYSGSATNLNGENVDYRKEVICDYVLNDDYCSK
ncbi:hypothetical protein [Thomasclavelia sp.]